ncbi:thiol reductant ABC exporter subunit CydD [Phyllobacterium sp. SYP-B3895]|uniref:thiol reductant ABC exporter subunit CydD n=1 Tax=Phyllobacterium sp. SYP-B3895 TaxID=2663240 RepID=UPI001299EC70|nr:thiol reductant ABC exporter subunit CydD [Phyllobacterium sp. SYP-B3895]MRG58206.1 thiol reductant ABC exporter subunit CydD [Phyllobacterium sp. SYP-B3895]
MGPAADASLALRSEVSPADACTVRESTHKPSSSLPIDKQKPARAKAPALLQLAATLLWLPQAWLLAMAVGQIIAGTDWRNIVWLAVGVVALGVLRSALDAAGTRVAFLSARKTLSELRQTAIACLARRSPLDITRPASGLAASGITEQAEAILPYLARFQPARLKATYVPLAILASIVPFSWVPALVLLMAAPLIPLFMALIGWRAKAASEKQLVEMGSMNGFLLDRLRGMTTIRVFDAVDLTADRLRANAESLRSRTMAVLRVAFLSSAVLELFAALGVAMVAVYIGFHYLGQLPFGAWGGRLDLIEGLFILLLAPAFFEPLRELSSVWHDRAAGEAALAALAELSDQGIAIVGGSGSNDQNDDKPASVSIEGLGYSHAARDRDVLEDFDLEVKPGERVAILGPSGSGKSTLLALIAGLAPLENGRIIIGGEHLTSATADQLRNRMIWIGQRPHIFAGSLCENIALGRPDVDRARTNGALALAALEHVAKAHGNLQLGEGGSGLSGGEILRLALARAAAGSGKNLILADEPTAHLDTITACEITEGLLEIARGKTLIVATHDPILAARMDRIVRLSPQIAQEAA